MLKVLLIGCLKIFSHNRKVCTLPYPLPEITFDTEGNLSNKLNRELSN